MNKEDEFEVELAHLPKEFINKLTNPVSRFLHIEAIGGLILLLSMIIALILSNSPWADDFRKIWEVKIGFHISSYGFSKSIKEWLNDGLMTLFFFIISLELKRYFAFGGIAKFREGMFATLAAFGGMLIPVIFYVILLRDSSEVSSWGTVMVTDTAFVVGALGILGSRINNSLRIFLLSLAIVDDVCSILVVTFFYSHHLYWLVIILAIGVLIIIRLMTLAGIRNLKIYLVIGCVTWVLFDASGIHATIAGVILGLMTPSRRWIDDTRLYNILNNVTSHPTNKQSSYDTKDRHTLYMAEIAIRESLSPIERLIVALHPWVNFVILPLFILANASINLSFKDINSYLIFSVFVAFVLGKPIGILSFSWLAVVTRVATFPSDLNWGLLIGGAILAGTGFTMALFITNLTSTEQFMNSIKIAILLASGFSIIIGLLFLTIYSHVKNQKLKN
ncbi:MULTISPECIES: Na+/H+ antiporter NhaA [Francisella]|uniref:Na(+)/H(+) antiporter NhaA n=1 Tax=Francisella opportunistica TaxID=2016517 RepID=A0A345JRP1_9GAMM|nr:MULTISPECIES: Na+/H+ antiporter NhaA [Francisella]APC91724.1 Na+/H+ antiporter NhaA type [Francisella sp. MA067296]AXH29987.1 Na+/H+ antiporter NhaA [Francisella opportunistica]AXH31631.1 Na+/H+ antiporter NhaA [Francisella opportunistica]AXH33277.1 Na+/H+ antiporter NhaA [Francisella opportunistica]